MRCGRILFRTCRPVQSYVQIVASRHIESTTDLFSYYFQFNDAVESSDDVLQRCDTAVLKEMEWMLK